MKRFIVLLLALLVCLSSAAALAEYAPLKIRSGESVSIRTGQWYSIDWENEKGVDMEWSSSNNSILRIAPEKDYAVIAAGIGNAELIGRKKGGSSVLVRTRIVVPIVYTTQDKIVIDSPEGAELGYAYNISGVFSMKQSGGCFEISPLDDDGKVKRCRVTPVKAGTGYIDFMYYEDKTKTVRVEVKRSAFGDTQEEVAQVLGETMAVTNRGVSIRKEPRMDSKKLGTARQGEKLIVTQAFYDKRWHQIDYNGVICYVNSNYCDLLPEENDENTAETAEKETPAP